MQRVQVFGRRLHVAALLGNLVPAFGVLYLGWDVGLLVLLYWLENLLIGVANLARMGVVAIRGGPTAIAVLGFMGPFFATHYGMFCAVHGLFMLALFQPLGLTADFDVAAVWRVIPQAIEADAVIAVSLVVFAVVEAAAIVAMVRKGTGGAGVTALAEQMFAPYARIVALHLGILAAAFALAATNQPAAGLLIVVVAKALYEAFVGQAEPKPNPKPKPPAPSAV